MLTSKIYKYLLKTFLIISKYVLSDEEENVTGLHYDTDDVVHEDSMILDAPITEAEVRKCIVKLKNNKAAGVDCIAN